MTEGTQIDLFAAYFSIMLGFVIGIEPPRFLNADRQRVSMMFLTGSTLFAQAMKLEISHNHAVHFGLWLLVLGTSNLIGKLIFDSQYRTFGPLIGTSIFTGALLGAGELLPALVATLVYPTLLALLRSPFDEDHCAHKYVRAPKPVYITAFLILLLSLTGAFLQVDGPMTEAIRNATSSSAWAMGLLAHVVEGKFLLPTCFIIFGTLWFTNRQAASVPLLAAAAWGAGEGIAFLLKHLLARPSPLLLHDLGTAMIQPQFFPWGHGSTFVGFPSAHATAYFALAWFISNSRPIRPRFHWLALFIAAGLSLGRITLKQHFFADIVAAAAIGVICAQLVLQQTKHWRFHR